MKDMYIAACDEKGGIYHYEIVGETVTERQFFPLDQPMYMEINGDKLFAVLRDPENTGNSGIITLDIDSDGNLSNKSKVISTLGAVGCHLTVKNGEVFVANYVSGSVFRTPDLLKEHFGKGVNPKRQDASHIHCTVATPDENYIAVADLGLDKVYFYDNNLKLVNSVDFEPGAGPRHIVFSDDGQYLYCITELSNEIYTFKYNDAKCQLLNRISTLPESFKDKNTAAAIRLNNGYLYASNRGHNSIAVYKLSDSIPKLVKIVSCGGLGPRDFNIFGDLLACTNENSNDVTFFKLENGIPKTMDFKLTMPNPLNIIFKVR